MTIVAALGEMLRFSIKVLNAKSSLASSSVGLTVSACRCEGNTGEVIDPSRHPP